MHSSPQLLKIWTASHSCTITKKVMLLNCHLHSCATASSWGLNTQFTMRLLNTIKKPDSMFKMHAGWFQRARWLLCCPRYTAFFLRIVLKEQSRKKKETPVPPHKNHTTNFCNPYQNSLGNQCWSIISQLFQNTLEAQLRFCSLAHSRYVTPLGLRVMLSASMYSTYLPPIPTLKRILRVCRSHPCSIKLQALFIPEKSTRKASQDTPQRTNAYQNWIPSQQAKHLLTQF